MFRKSKKKSVTDQIAPTLQRLLAKSKEQRDAYDKLREHRDKKLRLREEWRVSK